MVNDITVGIIGLGPMGLRHVAAAQQVAVVKKIVATDLNRDRSAYLKAGGATICLFKNSTDEVLAEGPDAVIVSTNGPSHYEIAKKAIEAGVRLLLIEKPVTTCIRDALDLKNAAEKTNTRIVVNLIRRYSSICREIDSFIKKNADRLGKTVSMYAPCGCCGLGCNGSHLIDFGSMLLDDRPRYVVAQMEDLGVPNPRGKQFRDPGGYGIIIMQKGNRIFFEMGESIGVTGPIIVMCEKGRVIMDGGTKTVVAEARRKEDFNAPVTKLGLPLEKIYTSSFELDVVECSRSALENLLSGKTIVSDVDKGIESLKAIAAFYFSNKRGTALIDLDRLTEEEIETRFSFT